MEELKEVTWSAANEIVYVDGFFDDDADSGGINIAEVDSFNRITWNQPQYKDNPKVVEAIESASQYLSAKNVAPAFDTISLEQFKEDVSELTSFWESMEFDNFKQSVCEEAGEDIEDTDEMIKVANNCYLKNHNYMLIRRIKQFLENNP